MVFNPVRGRHLADGAMGHCEEELSAYALSSGAIRP